MDKAAMSSTDVEAFEVRRWVLEQVLSIAALVTERHRCGVYVLKFANGERYVISKWPVSCEQDPWNLSLP